QGNHQAADQAFHDAIAAAPTDATLARQYGSALLQRGEAGRAISFLSTAARLGDTSSILRHNLGLAYFQTGDYAGAVAQWQPLASDTTLHPALKTACLLAGQSARKAQRYPEAISYWERAVQFGEDAALLNEEIGKASIVQAVLAAQAGDPQSAWEPPI